MNALVSLILAASLLLGGGATMAAAQDDLPNQSLYQLKLWTENAKMAMTDEPQEQANLLMNMAQTRVQEMVALVEQGLTPPAQVHERLEAHLNQALQLATNMDEATREQTLLQLQDRLQTQDRILEQLQLHLHVNAEIEPLLTRTRQMLQTRLQLIDEGLADPQGFQYMLENQMQYGEDEEVVPEPNQQGEPGFHQNDENGAPAEAPGAGDGEGNDSPGSPNPDAPQTGNGGNSSGNDAPGGPNPEGQQNGQNETGGGGGGGNK